MALRNYYQIPCYSADAQAANGWMNLTQAARILSSSRKTLRLAAERVEIEAQHHLPNGPWIINRRALEAQAAVDLVK